MILPQPESDLSQNTLVLGCDVIQQLKSQEGFVVIEDVMDHFLEARPQRTPGLFMDALTYLFAVGLIEYQGYKIRLRKKDNVTQLSLF
jgi:hypothetical protein